MRVTGLHVLRKLTIAAQALREPTRERLQDPPAEAFDPRQGRCRYAGIWDTRTGRPITDPLEHREAVRAAVFSPDGGRVVTASSDHAARVWDARTGKPVTGPLMHRGSVNAAAFSPDGARVVTASDDGTARVTAAAFSSDGGRVVTASWDHTARVWDLPMGSGSLSDWQRRARCAPFALDHDVLVENHAPCP